ncbi:ABC transporter substrate-binding protein [Streptomyces sp. MAR4 CNX-425]|uniref:ABC transporter substrate-binding protein n=1 Tax=Streptomyces sp. MAR4 CNX-425 TaxID=3406343 RepID=UPI003B5055ED
MTLLPYALPRRSVLAAAAGSAAVATLPACGGATSSSGDGTLTAGFDNEPVTLDPALSAAISSDRNILNLFYDSLLRQRRDGSFAPALATRWEAEDSAVTFTLRKDVTFHDGTRFDADAVVFNLKRVMDPGTHSTKAAALAKVASVEARGPRTVRLALKEPDPLLLIQLAHETGMMASPTALRENPGDFGRHPVGTGPFTFREWRSKVQLTAERNTSYWAGKTGGGAPKLEKVVVRFMTEAKVLRAELTTGGLHLVRTLPPEEYKQLAGDGQLTIEDAGVRRSYYTALNVTRGPLKDPLVREAFALAVDPRAVGKAAAAGEFDIAPSFATSGDWFYDGSLPAPAYDPDRARSTLRRAGLGGNVPITIVARRRAPDPTIAELLQSQLSEVGFAPEVEVLEFQTLLQRLQKQDFDAGLLVIDVPRLDPSLTFDPYFASDGPNNWSGLDDRVLDARLDEAAGSTDQAARTRAYVDIQRRILAQHYWVFLHQAKSPLIHSADLKGLELDIDGQWRLAHAHLAA